MIHEFPVTPDSARKFGCGRYRQEPQLLAHAADEILRFGRHPLFVCDDTSRDLAFDAVAASLRAAGVEPRCLVHRGFCNLDDARDRAAEGALAGIDVVVGCGGGVVLDFAKCLADLAAAPVVTIPTSSAQCCAYTPLAVCYTREGRYEKTALFRREIAAALLDTALLARQPKRLLVAGALDAMAKKIEIEFWNALDRSAGGSRGAGILPADSRSGSPRSDSPLAGVLPQGRARSAARAGLAPVRIAELVADFIYDDLDRKLDAAVADLARGEPTPTLDDVFFDSVVGAGFVSGISGGKRQTALAHRFYFFVRAHHPAAAARLTHGELVAIGLVLQIAYYGRFDEARALAARLRGWGLAASLGDLGLPTDEAEAAVCFDFLAATREMKTAGESALPRLKAAVEAVLDGNR